MTGVVFAKTMGDLRRGLIGWGIAITILVLAEAALWPSVRNAGLEQLVKNYPEGLRKLFNLDAMTTGGGFMNAELFSLMLPGLFIGYAIAKAARLVAGEEESGTLDVLLTTPASPTRILLEKACALASGVGVLALVLAALLSLASPIVGLGISVGAALTGSFAIALIAVEHGLIAFAVAAASGRRIEAIAVAGTVAVAGYIWYVAGSFVNALAAYQDWSPFGQALAAGPLGGGIRPVMFWMPAIGIALAAAGIARFGRRDINAAT